MLRRIGLCLVALSLLAGCQTTRARERAPAAPPEIRSPNRGSSIPYDGVQAPVHVELRLCDNTYAFNTGPVGWRREAMLYTPYIMAPSGAILLRNPTDRACLSSGYGFRSSAAGGGRSHFGMDLANPGGGFVYAAGDGRVLWSGLRGSYGYVVEIDHGMDTRTLYGHLAEINPRVSTGSMVRRGSAIGRMGATGNATGVHLHYEVIVNDIKVDPLTYGAAMPIS